MKIWSIKISTHREHRKYLKDILERISNSKLNLPEYIRSKPYLPHYINATFDGDPEDYIPEDIYLYSEVINDIAKDDKDAFFRLNSLYLMLNGLIFLFFDKFHKIEKKELSLHKFHKVEKENLTLYQDFEDVNIEDEIEYLYPLSNNNPIKDIEINDYILDIVKLSIQHRDIFEFLMQLGFEYSWSRLYSIWDSIRTLSEDFPQKRSYKEFLTIDKNEDELLDKFTCSVNSYALLFLESRHGKKHHCPETKRISKDEAKKLIIKMFFRFIHKKYGEPDMFEIVQNQRKKREFTIEEVFGK